MYFCHGSNHSRGALLLFAKNVDVKVEEVVKDVDGRSILLKGLIGDMRLLIGKVYLQQGEIFSNKKLSCKNRL